MKLTDEIKAALGKVDAEHSDGPGLSDREWTRRIKEELGAMGKHKGYYAYGLKGAPEHCDDGEFMFDLCWLDYGQGDTWLKRIPMAMECEWRSADDIDDDFLKLVVTRADLKVMIFGAQTHAQFDEIVKRLRQWKEAFEAGSPNDEFLLCGWCGDTRAFKFHTIP